MAGAYESACYVMLSSPYFLENQLTLLTATRLSLITTNLLITLKTMQLISYSNNIFITMFSKFLNKILDS